MVPGQSLLALDIRRAVLNSQVRQPGGSFIGEGNVYEEFQCSGRIGVGVLRRPQGATAGADEKFGRQGDGDAQGEAPIGLAFLQRMVDGGEAFVNGYTFTAHAGSG